MEKAIEGPFCIHGLPIDVSCKRCGYATRDEDKQREEEGEIEMERRTR